MYEIEYIDDRPIFIPKLDNYKGGVSLPNPKNNIIKVSETERKHLLSQTNGLTPCWREVEKKITRQKTTKEE